MTIEQKIYSERLNIQDLAKKNDYHKRMYERCKSIFDALTDSPRHLYITAAELYYMCDEKEKETLIGGFMGAGVILKILMELYPSFVEKQQAFHKNVYHIPAHLKDLKA